MARRGWVIVAVVLLLASCGPVRAADQVRVFFPVVPAHRELAAPPRIWQWQNPLPRGGMLWSVSFADDAVGWVVGDGGGVMKSTDAGQSWSVQSSGTTEQLLRVRALSPTVAWASGVRRIIIRTEDGGTTWQQQRSPAGGTLYLAPASASVAWLVSGDFRVFRTDDGGRTWSHQAMPDSALVLDVVPVDEAVAWAVSGVGVLRTTDGGSSWGWAHRFSSAGSAKIGAASADVAWVAHQWLENRAVMNEFLATVDGGATWIPQSGPALPSQIVPVSSSVVWALAGEVWLSEDGGASWSRTERFPVSHAGLAARSATTAWAVGDYGSVRRTTDGSTWTRTTGGHELYVSHLSAVSPTTVWAAGGDTVLVTTDGGESWTARPTGVSGSAPALAAASATRAWLVGQEGLIRRTDDGGQTWIDQPSGTSQWLRSASAASDEVAWAVGNSGTVLRTEDGGATWRSRRPPMIGSTGLTKVHAVSPSAAWLIGGQFTVLRTADGGLTWQSRGPNLGYEWNDLAAASDTAAWLVQAYGSAVARTTDGGLNWTLHSVPFRPLAVGAASATTAWVTDELGNVWFTRDGGAVWTREPTDGAGYLVAVAVASPSDVWVGGAGGAILKREP